MKVTGEVQTDEGIVYSLDNGDSVLIKNSVGFTGKALQYTVYIYKTGMRYSARTGRYSYKTVIPASRAVERYLSAKS